MASERESKSLPEAVFYSDFFTCGHGLWSNMWSKVFESVLRAVVQSKINPFTVRYTQKQNTFSPSGTSKYEPRIKVISLPTNFRLSLANIP